MVYFIEDPKTGFRAQLMDFSEATIDVVRSNGLKVYARGEDGIETEVDVSNVVQIKPMNIELAGPGYVDERIEAVMDALEAIQALFDMKSLAALIKGDAEPLKTLKDKIEALRAFIPSGD